jgi:hypothetical protein
MLPHDCLKIADSEQARASGFYTAVVTWISFALY